MQNPLIVRAHDHRVQLRMRVIAQVLKFLKWQLHNNNNNNNNNNGLAGHTTKTDIDAENEINNELEESFET